jgi:DNA-binding response OmpR family regulator
MEIPEEKPILLVVEDEDDYRYMITLGLKNHFTVIEARDGYEGLELAHQHIPDLIIADLMMPLMGGMEMCRQLKTHVETSHIPVIMLTAKGSVESEIEGLTTGADAYIAKPFNMQLLKARIGNLLNSRRVLRDHYNFELWVGDKPDSKIFRDHDFLRHVFDVINENCEREDFSVEMLARKLNMSVRSLHRKMKALANEKPSKMIWMVRVKKAATLLKSSDLSITEVAFKVGFSETSHFSRVFREQYGMSPSEYRAKFT